MTGHLSTSIADLLDHGPRSDDAIAIEAPGRNPLTYGRLRAHIRRTIEALNVMGFGRNDRIAVALPNGPELAVAVLSIASGFTCVPLNPGLQRPEFERCLADTRACALISFPGEPSPAVEAARSLGITIIELSTVTDEAGLFELQGAPRPATSPGGLAEGEDVALLLQTSGTTSHSKLIPLTHNNICYTQLCMGRAFRMSDSDRCLNFAPLFLTQGIVGSLFTSMAAGGSVVCTPGFSDSEFPQWLVDFRPTWYLGSPVIHQKAIESIERDGRPVPKTLRFIRSSTSPMPVPLMAKLEQVFGTVMIEVYGMTETGQITSNPLPPLSRKPGSVGITDLRRCRHYG